MAHFAELDENNKVIQVIVVKNDVLDVDNEEKTGLDFLSTLFPNKKFKQTSYNASFRGKHAAIGDTYNAEIDEFIGVVNDIELLD